MESVAWCVSWTMPFCQYGCIQNQQEWWKWFELHACFMVPLPNLWSMLKKIMIIETLNWSDEFSSISVFLFIIWWFVLCVMFSSCLGTIKHSSLNLHNTQSSNNQAFYVLFTNYATDICWLLISYNLINSSSYSVFMPVWRHLVLHENGNM